MSWCLWFSLGTVTFKLCIWSPFRCIHCLTCVASPDSLELCLLWLSHQKCRVSVNHQHRHHHYHHHHIRRRSLPRHHHQHHWFSRYFCCLLVGWLVVRFCPRIISGFWTETKFYVVCPHFRVSASFSSETRLWFPGSSFSNFPAPVLLLHPALLLILHAIVFEFSSLGSWHC